MAAKEKQSNLPLLVSLGVVVLLILGYFLVKGNSKSANPTEVLSGEVIVEMGEDDYTPNEFTITKGTTVTFVNTDDAPRWPASDLHPSHGIYPEFDPNEPVPSGESWSFVFNEVGEWTMHDHLAPYITGTITVVAE